MKLPTPANYLIGTLLVLALAIPVGIAIVAIAGIYWTSRAIRALSASHPSEQGWHSQEETDSDDTSDRGSVRLVADGDSAFPKRAARVPHEASQDSRQEDPAQPGHDPMLHSSTLARG